MFPIFNVGGAPKTGRVDEVPDEVALSVSDLEKVYGSGGGAVRAVNGVSFDIERGTAVGILGPNGAGKTTTIKSMLSLVVPSTGAVHIDGIDVHREPKRAFQRVGAMLEGARNTYWRLTVRENLEFFSVLGGRDYRDQQDRIDELLEQFNLVDKADTVVRELSRGQQQKVSLAATMARNADVLFLDEPTLGLDVESSLELRTELRDMVENDGTTVILSSHDMNVVQEVCDRVIIMDDGEIIADDAVDDLLELFNTQIYDVTVDGRLDSDVRTALKSTFDVLDLERRRDSTVVTVRISEGDFYHLVDLFRDAGHIIRSCDDVDHTLEDAFLQLTGGVGDSDDGTGTGQDMPGIHEHD